MRTNISIPTNTVKNRIQGESNAIIYNLFKYKYLYLLLIPAVLFVVVFQYIPILGNIIAFQDYSVLKGFMKSEFVGFKNFITIFQMPNFYLAIKNTLINSTTLIFGTFPLPILLALMITEVKNVAFKKAVQTISYLPHFLSWIAVCGIFYSFFEMYGTFNDLRIMLFGEGTQRVNILMDSENFLTILYASHVWKSIGWSSIIYFAAISGIDPTMYEAAQIDGCSKFKQVLHITLPSIAPTIVIVLIMSIGGLVMANFDQVYGLQNLYTQVDTEVINTVVYRTGLLDGKYSMAAAFGMSQGIVSFLLVITANTLSKKIFEIGLW